MIADYSSSFEISLLRASCVFGVTTIAPAKNKHDPSWLLIKSAKCGDSYLCSLARNMDMEMKHQSSESNSSSTTGANAPPRDYNKMLITATTYGHWDICFLAHKWARETQYETILDFNEMLRTAALHGHCELCLLACEWCDSSGTNADFNGMLYCAAQNGSRDLCILAKEWLSGSGVKPNYNAMLLGAALGGHRDLCILARKLINSTHYDFIRDLTFMLRESAKCPDPVRAQDVCALAEEWIDSSGAWGDVDFNEMLKGGSCSGNQNICILAREWAYKAHHAESRTGASAPPLNFNEMLCNAARYGHRELCLLACEWKCEEQSARLTRDSSPLEFDIMLYKAAYGGHKDICELAKEWATVSGIKINYEKMLENAVGCADKARRRDICELAREWGAYHW